MSTVIGSYDSEILARVVMPHAPTMSPAAAQEVLKLAFTADDRQRMSELVAKAREGTLTVEERSQADSYERVSSFIGYLKSKARISLKAAAPE